jgi:hypothetical protein
MFQSNNLFALHAYYLVSIQQSLLFKLVSFFKQNGKNWFLTKGMPSVVIITHSISFENKNSRDTKQEYLTEKMTYKTALRFMKQICMKNWFLTKGMPSVVGTQYITSPSGKQIFKVMSTVKP